MVANRAFRALLDGFPGLSWDNRLLILVPDDDFKSKLEPHLQRSLQAMRPVQLVGAEEASAAFATEDHDVDRVLLASVGAADGLERLAVILVGLDEQDPSDGARSLIYRGLTRAQMFAAVVNEQLEDGYLSWMNRVKLDEKEEFDKIERVTSRRRGRGQSSQALERALREQPLSLAKLAQAVTKARPFRLIPEVLQLVEVAEAVLVPLVKHTLADTEERNAVVLQTAILAANAAPPGKSRTRH